uniref:Cytosolic Fe-S cluster assembly factor nar-1 n=1 Tax=Anthurium amnicola TaxID=1678845 RepID=A0A1D1Z971_9ARAE
MNDYCKIGARSNMAAKSRSIDFSDLSFSPPQTPKYPNTHQERPLPPPGEEAGAGGERFGVILSRNCSSTSQRFPGARARPATGTLQAAVRRAFSMKRSSSPADAYRRIHDTAEDDGDGDCDADAVPKLQQQQQQQEEEAAARAPRKKRGKIARACKRLFGF